MSLIEEPLFFWRVATLVTFASTVVAAHRSHLNPWTMYFAGMAGLGGAVLASWSYVAFFAQNDGRAAIGAFIGAAAFGGLFLRVRGCDCLRYADAAVPGIALGYALYRVGCLFHGCCFGKPTNVPWSVTFSPGTEAFAAQANAGLIDAAVAHSLPVHPTQLYSAVIGLFVALTLSRVRRAPPGSRVALALILYGVARFVIEFYRGDAIPILGVLDANHIAALLMFVAGMSLWRFRLAFISVACSKPSV